MVFVGSGSRQFLIRIRLQGNYTDSTDPDPQHCCTVYIGNCKTNLPTYFQSFQVHLVGEALLQEDPLAGHDLGHGLCQVQEPLRLVLHQVPGSIGRNNFLLK